MCARGITWKKKKGGGSRGADTNTGMRFMGHGKKKTKQSFNFYDCNGQELKIPMRQTAENGVS